MQPAADAEMFDDKQQERSRRTRRRLQQDREKGERRTIQAKAAQAEAKTNQATAKLNARIAKLLKDGYSAASIAKRLGVTQRRIGIAIRSEHD